MNIKIKSNCTTIYLDLKNSSVSFYMMNPQNHITQDARNINAKFMSSEYFEKLTIILKELASKYTPSNASNTTVVLPDECVFMNTVSLPIKAGNDQKASYNAYLVNTFKNIGELNIISSKVVSNKQFMTLSLIGIRKDIVENIKLAFQNAKLVVHNITYESGATIAGINLISNKYKNQSYMFLDVKENKSKYILVSKGRPIGFFSLPIGYSSLIEKPAQEDVLLYNPAAELLVVNAREKANKKELTMSGNENAIENAEEQKDEFSDDFDNAFSGSDSFVPRQVDTQIKTLPKKVGRKLPKFMLRDVPEDDEHKVYENFRIFMKWGLDILEKNEKLSFVKPQAIYVNLNNDYGYLFDIANEEIEENKIKFQSAGLGKEKQDIINNLEKFGGLFAKDYKQTTLF